MNFWLPQDEILVKKAGETGALCCVPERATRSNHTLSTVPFCGGRSPYRAHLGYFATCLTAGYSLRA